MLHEHQSVRDDRHAQHLAAVRMSLGWADAAARAGDHADALHWLDVVEEVGDVLSAEYTAKRVAWRRALRGRAADVSATTPARARVGAMTCLHCPRCRPAVAQKAARLGMVHCPQC